MSDNSNLITSKALVNDEFYTRLEDIENELKHYRKHFLGKIVLCNCDDPRVSNFFRYFSLNFETLGLKKLICTCYKNQNADLFSAHDCEKAVYTVYEGDVNGNHMPDPEEVKVFPLKGDGDFRSAECIELLKQADIVVTNPPFSLFREYISLLVKYEKKFLIIGNQNAISTREIFSLLKENKVWLGYHNGHTLFAVPDFYQIPDSYDPNDRSRLRSNGYIIDDNGKIWRNLGNICWYTNLDIKKRHEEIDTYREYNPTDYPQYDNYKAIEVCPVDSIPADYMGVMGVPVTFMNKFNPDQFEIIGITESDKQPGYSLGEYKIPGHAKYDRPYLNGKRGYARIFIKRK